MGDRAANSAAAPLFAELAGHYAEVTAYIRRRVTCPELAADIVQDACLRLARMGEPAAIKNPRAFLYRVAGNLAIDHLRRERARAKFMVADVPAEEEADRRPSAETALGAREEVALLLEIVQELPPRCREVFTLRKFDDLDQAEIAARLGISRNMVEKHLRAGLLHCTARLGEYDI